MPQRMPYGRRYDSWDTYTWNQLILPYIDQAPSIRLTGRCNQSAPIYDQLPAPTDASARLTLLTSPRRHHPSRSYTCPRQHAS